MCGKELSVASGDLHHAHRSARPVPDRLLQIPVKVEQQTFIYLLCRYEKMLFPIIIKWGD